jgi:DNA-directed RNA polymerase specialized sigma24 family protein
MAKKSVHYVNNAQLYEAMCNHKKAVGLAEESAEDKPQIPEYVGECLLKIAQRLATKPNFINYTYKEEMISDGIENCINYLDNFNPEKSKNPFAYFTQIIYYAFLRRIQKEKKQLYIKHKTLENAMVMDELSDGEGGSWTPNLNTDYMNDFVENFESKERAKREKRISQKKEEKTILEKSIEK